MFVIINEDFILKYFILIVLNWQEQTDPTHKHL